MSRETREITTPGGRKVVLHTYLTARESNELKKFILKDAKLSVVEGREVFEGLSAGIAIDQEQKLLELAVVSIDGKTENIGEQLLDLPDEDYRAIVDECGGLRAGFQTAISRPR
jgi:hypothetical protein